MAHSIVQDPVVQNLTKLLANVTLKILSWNMANTLIFFCWKNVSSFCIDIFLLEKMWVAFAMQKLLTFFQQKNINVFENTLIATTVNEFVINELVKLMMLWTTGPCCFQWTTSHVPYLSQVFRQIQQLLTILVLKFEQIYFCNLLCLKTAYWVTNSVDLDHKLHSVTSNLGLQFVTRLPEYKR